MDYGKLTFILLICAIFALGTACVKVQDGGDKVSISPSGIDVESEDGDEVHIGAGGIHVTDNEGEEVHIDGDGITVSGDDEEVKIGDSGVFMSDSDGEKVEVVDNVVHISGENLQNYPENWPEEVKVFDSFVITDQYIRGEKDGVDGHMEIIARSVAEVDVTEVMDYYSLLDGWRPDMRSEAPEDLPDSAAWGAQLKDDLRLEITVIVDKAKGSTLQLRVYGRQ